MEVDVVYTWVNHLDPYWQSLHRRAMEEQKVPEGGHPSVNDLARFQNRNELYYSIRSVRRYAPWVRQIFIVTNCALPEWAHNDPHIVRVDHTEVFPDTSVLPTFNAFAIEACLHRVPDLSEHFIYFNDDVFLLKNTFVEDFFPSTGEISVFPSKHDMPTVWSDRLRPVEFSMLNARKLLANKFGYSPTKKLEHAPFPLVRSILYEIEQTYKNDFDHTRSHAFRQPSDIPPSTTLHAYYCVATGRGHIRHVQARYIDIGDPLFLLLVTPWSPLFRKKYTFLCLNEVHSIKYFSGMRDAIVGIVMKRLLG